MFEFWQGVGLGPLRGLGVSFARAPHRQRDRERFLRMGRQFQMIRRKRGPKSGGVLNFSRVVQRVELKRDIARRRVGRRARVGRRKISGEFVIDPQGMFARRGAPFQMIHQRGAFGIEWPQREIKRCAARVAARIFDGVCGNEPTVAVVVARGKSFLIHAQPRGFVLGLNERQILEQLLRDNFFVEPRREKSFAVHAQPCVQRPTIAVRLRRDHSAWVHKRFGQRFRISDHRPIAVRGVEPNGIERARNKARVVRVELARRPVRQNPRAMRIEKTAIEPTARPQAYGKRNERIGDLRAAPQEIRAAKIFAHERREPIARPEKTEQSGNKMHHHCLYSTRIAMKYKGARSRAAIAMLAAKHLGSCIAFDLAPVR
ncbi:MAG: hypothetical protein DCC52_03845 [Chloroflexi bacterium]|nr:MAG: hypothetical protein DCC52_03845 [Chloroflexota bacterium]